MANMKVVSEIELSVPVAEKHIEAAKSAASFLTTDKSSIQIEIEGENKNWICTSFLVKKARQMDVCDKIMREMRMDMEDYQDQTLYFPKTEAERRREQRKQERAKERRRLARLQREADKAAISKLEVTMKDGQMPNPVLLDDEKPTKEQLREAYGLALRLWELAPWDMPMGENQLLVVERADGRKFALSVMGEYGEHRAVSIYPSVSSYCRIAGVPQYDQLRLQDAFFSIRQLQFAFLKAAHLLKAERAAIKEAGVKFPRGVNPSLASYVPGYASEMMGANELAEAMDAIKVLLDFFKTHSAEDINIFNRNGDLISVWRESHDGIWSLGEDEFSPLHPVAVNLSQALLEKVSALPVNKKLYLEIGAIPVPCGKSDSGRDIMGRFMIAVEGNTQFTMGVNLLTPPEGREFDWTPAVEFALDVIVKFGYKPGRLAVLGASLEGVLSGLCRSALKGTEFLPHSECEAVRDVYEFTAQRMGY